MGKLFFHNVLQFFLAFYTGREVGLDRALRSREPHFQGQGVDELVLPALYGIGELAVHGVHLQLQFLAQPLPFFAAGVFPPFEPDQETFLYVFGNLVRVDHAGEFIERHDEMRRRFRFGHPFGNGLGEDVFKFLAAHAFLDEADNIAQHAAVRVFQHGNDAVLEEAQEGLPFEVRTDMFDDHLLGFALAAVVIDLLGYFVEEGPEFFPAFGLFNPAVEAVHEGDLIELIPPHAGLEKLFRYDVGHAVDDLRAVVVDQFRVVREAQGFIKEGRHGEPVGNAADEGRLEDEEKEVAPEGQLVLMEPPDKNGQEADER